MIPQWKWAGQIQYHHSNGEQPRKLLTTTPIVELAPRVLRIDVTPITLTPLTLIPVATSLDLLRVIGAPVIQCFYI